MVLGAAGIAIRKIEKVFTHMESTFYISVGQKWEVRMTEYRSRQFHEQHRLFTVMKSYEKTKHNNMSNMVYVWG